jgi:hypothetical protein
MIFFIAPSLWKIGRAILPALWRSAVTYGVAVAKKRRSGVNYATSTLKNLRTKRSILRSSE